MSGIGTFLECYGPPILICGILITVSLTIGWHIQEEPDFYSNDVVYEDDDGILYLMICEERKHDKCLSYIYEHGGEMVSETYVRRGDRIHIEWKVSK